MFGTLPNSPTPVTLPSLVRKISSEPVLVKMIEPKLMVGLLNEPVRYMFFEASTAKEDASSLPVPPALFAQSTLPDVSYLARKISKELVPGFVLVKMVEPKLMVGLSNMPVMYMFSEASTAEDKPSLPVPPALFARAHFQ